ncbi:MAG: DUF91 domain-containing protein [Gammaproteobacteria bacterium]|nr:DUF91 domain-containing protein [Gammaproteobacteria bacterium]
MNTHVFIVDDITFKVHLEYLFAGTGAGNHVVDFNNSKKSSLHHSSERNLVSMAADGGRIRDGDNVLFYLQKGLGAGKFYGVFKACGHGCFLDNNNAGQYLKNDLKKSLTFRALLAPDQVYANGVTEWEALDEIKNISSPNQMLWSLIYRKLKGGRGNTMITRYESDRLIQLIRNKNQRAALKCRGKLLSFDAGKQMIVCENQKPRRYAGRQTPINILPRLIGKISAGEVVEAHLQAYISQNLGLKRNATLDGALLGSAKLEWLGNEVSCGVGMQSIDIMLSVTDGAQKAVMPVELKSVGAVSQNLAQLRRYIDWVEQYYVPNHQSDIRPVLLTKKGSANRAGGLVADINAFNQQNKRRCARLKFVEFDLVGKNLVFKSVKY